ncbi:pentapeptide repeat-containing protein [Prochlorococcus sp. MIT 1201]|uniref:pentapeptide repeat-containing protein n=1 Tax=Prochlorococcus sp. MIT 1201 TaxID=3082535 RepID=UPI0039A6E27A
MQKIQSSVLRSLLLGILIPIAACLYLILPLAADATYPSMLENDQGGADPSMLETRKNLDALSKKYPFLDTVEDGKPLTAEFVKYDLAGYDLSEADLRGSTFSITTLKNANLHGTNLEDVLAYATRFDNADLSESILRNANLRKSEFAGALIDGADFTNALLDRQEQKALCARATGKNSKTGVDTYTSLDCSGISERVIPAGK